MSRNSFLRIPHTNYGEILEHSYDIVILPWGAVEPHNYHLPYLTDCILSYEIACDCADEVLEKGVTCMVMPPVFSVHKMLDNGTSRSVYTRAAKRRKRSWRIS